MDDSEKMVALKKAYAEIILNTAKEAAARVMASERRALRSQHDVNAAKDEALRLLLHLKKMVDAKETEAEINAISQRRRIEELEAHLQEAEDQILDLRTELRNVSDEVEKKKNEMQLLSSENSKEDAVDPKHEMPNLDPIVPYSSDSELETIAASAVINRGLSGRFQDNNCFDATKQAGQLAGSALQKYFGHSSDIASIILRSAEPELCRNGCTQRIRAFERQHAGDECTTAIGGLKAKAIEKDSKSTLAFPKVSSLTTRKNLFQEEIKKSKLQMRRRRKSRFMRSKSSSRRSYSHQLVSCSHSSTFVADCNSAYGKSKDGEAIPAKLPLMDAKQDMPENPAGSQEKLQNDINPFTVSKVLKGKRKKNTVRRTSLETSATSVSDHRRTSLVNGNVKRDEVCIDVCKDRAEMGALQCCDPLLLLSKSTEKLSNESPLIEQKNNDAEEPDIPTRDSELKDAHAARDSEGPSKAKDSRLLKYTFQRKRKKDCPNEGASPEKCSTKKLAMDTEDAALESKRSTVVNEPSRDSRRLAQVARQEFESTAVLMLSKNYGILRTPFPSKICRVTISPYPLFPTNSLHLKTSFVMRDHAMANGHSRGT